ncbi:MAG: hypothetical protein IKL84_04380 [Clostridia bacterium]|nr:hypothetical protein [Clostridia bacterium]
MKKILVAFLFVLIGFFTLVFTEVSTLMEESYIELFTLLPYLGIPLAIWGMFEKK